MSTADIDAINTYITTTATVTPEAGNLQAQWKTWYGNLNFMDKMTDATFHEASDRRTVFNAANMQPEPIASAADLTPDRMVAKQAAIAKSPALSPTQKAAALAKNPTIPTTAGVPGSAVKHATIRQGSKGSDVVAWQNIIGVKPADGVFGSGTATATKAWQKSKGLTADGVVGPNTWSAAIGAPVQEATSGTIDSSGNTSFVPAPATSPPFATVSPTVQAHVAAVKAGTTPPPTSDVKKAASIVASSSLGHTALKVGIPVVATVAGGWLFGTVGVIVGGIAGLFGSSKV